MILAQVRNGEIVKKFYPNNNNEYKGWVIDANSKKLVSPPYLGFTSANDSILEYEIVVIDNSTQDDITSETSAFVVSNNTITETITIEDGTITEYMVDAERDRRLELDFMYNGKMFQRDRKALNRINGAYSMALAAIVGGAQVGDYRWSDPNNDFQWITSDNSVMIMDAQMVLGFGQAAASIEANMVFAGRVLKETNPIPLNYTDNSHWS